MKLKIAIVGCGAATERYYLPALTANKRLLEKLYWIDTNPDNAEKMKQQLAFGEITDNYKDIVDKVDGAVIVVPHFLHFKIARDFLSKGVHVLCEKPLSETADEVNELAGIAEKNKVGLCVNNTRRMFPNFKKAKEIMDSGKLGKVTRIEYTEGANFAWPSATSFFVDPSVTNKGILLDLGAHVLDTMCWWLNSELEITSCMDDSFGGPESVTKIAARSGKTELTILLNRLVDLKNSFTITCEKGLIRGEIFNWNSVIVQDDKGINEIVKTHNKITAYPDFVKPIFNNFVNVMLKKETPLIGANDVFPSVLTIEKSYKIRKRFELPWYTNLENIVNV